MTNDLATMNTELATALRDPSNKTWTSAERDNLLRYACARMYPKVARRVRESVTLVSDQEQYTLATVSEINRVDILDSAGKLLFDLGGGSWEFWGDGETAGGTLFINRNLSTSGQSLRVHGWAPYNLSANYPVDRYVPFLLAMARVEACRREITRRSNFTEWQSTNQVQNISTYELILMVNEADTEVRNLGRELRTWRRPSPAHV